MVSYSGTSKKARDNRRMADLEKIRIALELYRQNVGTSYPALSSSLVPSYLQNLPKDPKTNQDYDYTHSGYTYTITATLEETGDYTVTNP